MPADELPTLEVVVEMKIKIELSTDTVKEIIAEHFNKKQLRLHALDDSKMFKAEDVELLSDGRMVLSNYPKYTFPEGTTREIERGRGQR